MQVSTSSLSRSMSGPFLVGLAALLWATDALVRYPTSSKIDPTVIVFIEHIIAIVILLPWLVFKSKISLFSLNFKEWLAAIFSGIGGSAIAFLFFTASFLYVNPSVSILLQKLQPILVVVIATFLLGEKPARKFYFWGTIALGAGVILSFPDLNFNFLSNSVDLHSKGIQYSLGAAFLWAASTVSGKVLVERTPPLLATFWRFFFGLLALSLILVLAKESPDWNSLAESQTLFALLYMSLVPGVLAVVAYYYGLSRTPASVTTFIELLYPIGAVSLNTLFLHTPLEATQTVSGLILLIAVAMISF